MAEKLRSIVNGEGTFCGHYHFCPGCEKMHRLPPGWTFNGDLVKPTYTPSFKHTWGLYGGGKVCHYILTDGVLNYCSDSTHALAGKAVPLPDIPPQFADWGR